MMRRIAITGVGAVSALGIGAQATWRALCDGQSGIDTLDPETFGALRFRAAAMIRVLPGDGGEGKRNPPARFTRLALIAAREAWEQTGLTVTDTAPERVAVIVGSAVAAKDTEEAAYKRLLVEGQARVDPMSIPRAMGSAPASAVAACLGARGPVMSCSTACAASAHAIMNGALLVGTGLVDVAVVGGTETPLTATHLGAWDALRVISPTRCRPFDASRDGLTLGEGAAFMVLECVEAATARGARTDLRLLGWGATADGACITGFDTIGASVALAQAIRATGSGAGEVRYVNAHGTGTPTNDRGEALAIREVFGDRSYPMVSSTKGAHGHLLGAGSALETVLTAMALRTQIVPPNVGCHTVAEDCPVDLVCRSRPEKFETALCASFAFGGVNAVLALGLRSGAG